MNRLALLMLVPVLLAAQSPRTKIVMLGTGTPIPDPDRQGPALVIVVLLFTKPVMAATSRFRES